MYPTIYHALLDLTGLDLPFLKFLNSFGFFVALAFIAASWSLTHELRRKEAGGLLVAGRRTVQIGLPARPGEIITNGIIGFLIGWKGVYLLTNMAEATEDTQGFLLSMKGNLLGGIALGALLAWWKWRDKERQKLAEPRTEEVVVHAWEHAGTITLLAALWGFIGAKLFHWLENPKELVEFFTAPSGKDMFSGLTMYGGLILAGVMVVRYMVKHGIPAFVGMDAAAPGLMLAYAIGRIGCHVSGDGDWGIVNIAPPPAWLPDWLWAYDYPNNVIRSGHLIMGTEGCFPGYCTFLDPPVYPTPLYEAIICGLFAGILFALRKRLAIPGMLFAVYLILNGIERFFIERIRVNEKLIGAWTQAEVIAVLLVVLGVGGWFWAKRKKTDGPATAH